MIFGEPEKGIVIFDNKKIKIVNEVKFFLIKREEHNWSKWYVGVTGQEKNLEYKLHIIKD